MSDHQREVARKIVILWDEWQKAEPGSEAGAICDRLEKAIEELRAELHEAHS